ncbi:hypothetical protein B0T09DRAFT_131558 [Sordaria sp. MPI-SDFR-AT-0083]|nr:hypothetical protein B0T09DRAFT_131558 [Sordaria sp. MPI-SDFR-AT-0083]
MSTRGKVLLYVFYPPHRVGVLVALLGPLTEIALVPFPPLLFFILSLSQPRADNLDPLPFKVALPYSRSLLVSPQHYYLSTFVLLCTNGYRNDYMSCLLAVFG